MGGIDETNVNSFPLQLVQLRDTAFVHTLWTDKTYGVNISPCTAATQDLETVTISRKILRPDGNTVVRNENWGTS